ncbi:MAG: LysM peptidoglycan-binding domain-containing protein [Methyloprofundus sp.]|nr:LysM peptidoglycan-binding domain-containing protein [Methyloprofundus sp.]
MRTLVGLIFFFMFSFICTADVVKINSDHPTKHIVVKGDTLWDISARFLENPWEWPKVWRHNSQIKNPHLIYPGDIITLCFINNQPMLCVNSEDRLQPRIRYEDHEPQAIAMIPMDVIRPFLISPKVLNEDELNNAPYIVAFADEHIIAGTDANIYVRSILKREFMRYTTYRVGETYKDPDTDEILGYQAIHIADNSIISLGDPATLSTTRALREVRLGDHLMPAEETEFNFNFYPIAPKEKIKTTIIASKTESQEIGQFDVVVLSKGAKDGLKTGHILDIIQEGKLIRDPYNKTGYELVKLPDSKSGSVLVFRTFDRVSYALIMHATKNIRLLDKANTPE